MSIVSVCEMPNYISIIRDSVTPENVSHFYNAD